MKASDFETAKIGILTGTNFADIVSEHLPDPEGSDLRQHQRVLQAFAGTKAKAEDTVSQTGKQEERSEEKA